MTRKFLPPRQYYTKERVEERQRGAHPQVLFHFTGRTKALKILEDGFLRGRPQLSLTENPAFVVPGPVVFVIDPACTLQKGFELWPHIWQRGAQEEAEWIVVPAGTEEKFDLPEATKLPLDCVTYVGLIGWVGAERQEILEAAEALEIPAGQFDWEEWWGNGPKPKLSGPLDKKRQLSDHEAREIFSEGEAFELISDYRNCVSWIEEPRYPVRNFIERPLWLDRPPRTPESWRDWLESERQDRPEYLDQLEKAWTRDPESVGPIIVAEMRDGTIDIGDGWHRAALSVMHKMKTVPAIVGKECGPKPKLDGSGRVSNLPFFSTCVGWPLPVDELTEMIDTSKDISRKTFLKYVDPEQMLELERDLGYERRPSRGLTMAQDYGVSYSKGLLRGCPAVYFTWSAIEHVFVDQACLER